VLRQHQEPLKIVAGGHKEYLHELIARLTAAGKFEEFSNLFKMIDHMTRDDSVAEQRANNFFKGLQQEKLPEGKCLGCTPFFFKNMNIYHPDINKQPILTLSSVKDMKNL
jgi:hypothetical protein